MMAIAGPRPAGEDGSPRRAGRGWAPHAAAAVVLVVGLGITITLSVVTSGGHQRTNAKLLALETRLISDDIAAAEPLYVEDHLGGAASLAAATDGSAATFARELSGSGTANGAFVTASLWRLGGTLPRQITRVGTTLLTTAARGTLIAYTDGLVERRGETLDTGLKRLLQTATDRCGSSLDDLLTSLVSELTGDSPTDDIALIGLRWLN